MAVVPLPHPDSTVPGRSAPDWLVPVVGWAGKGVGVGRTPTVSGLFSEFHPPPPRRIVFLMWGDGGGLPRAGQGPQCPTSTRGPSAWA